MTTLESETECANEEKFHEVRREWSNDADAKKYASLLTSLDAIKLQCHHHCSAAYKKYAVAGTAAAFKLHNCLDGS